MRSNEKLCRVVLPYACAGVIVRAGTVVRAAPIFAWAVGKSYIRLRIWVQEKGGTITHAA